MAPRPRDLSPRDAVLGVTRMWSRTGGYECYMHWRGQEGILTLKKSGQVLMESKVDSPREAIQLAEQLFRSLR